jgi:hypothetical protein
VARFYIATSLSRVAEHNLVRDALHEHDHRITYDWTLLGPVGKGEEPRLAEVSEAEVKGIKDADFVVGLLPAGDGTHAEIGCALGLSRTVYLHTTDPALFFSIGHQTCEFYWHPLVGRSYVPTLAEFVKYLVAEVSFRCP